MRGCDFGNAKGGIGSSADRIRNGLCCRFLASEKTLPNLIYLIAKRSDPPHAANGEAHAAFWMITEALVPPKPKELERTARIGASRASFATMFSRERGIAGSKIDVRRQKLMLQRENADDCFDRAGCA